MSMIDLASWLGSLGRLGWLVIRAFHSSLLIGADLYLAGPPVESVRHGGADGRHLIPENNRHSRCDDDGSRDDGNGHGVVHPAEYALWGARFPARNHNQTDPLPSLTTPSDCHNQTGPLLAFPSGRLTSSNVATWVLSAQDSKTAPQTSQDTWPLCGIKHVGSMRLYSAPHSHRTSVVSILEICARNHPFSRWITAAIKLTRYRRRTPLPQLPLAVGCGWDSGGHRGD
jgi:hypothetical protein